MFLFNKAPRRDFNYLPVSSSKKMDIKEPSLSTSPKIRLRQLFPETWVWPINDILTRFEKYNKFILYLFLINYSLGCF